MKQENITSLPICNRIYSAVRSRFKKAGLPAIRINEWCILNKLLNKNDHSATTIEIFEEIHKYVNIEHSNNLIHACEILSRKHSDPVDTLQYQKGFCVFENDKISFNKDFIDELESNPMSSIFKLWVNDIIHYGKVRYTEEFGRDDYGFPFLKLYHGCARDSFWQMRADWAG